jgi:hypothetical protein
MLLRTSQYCPVWAVPVVFRHYPSRHSRLPEPSWGVIRPVTGPRIPRVNR